MEIDDITKILKTEFGTPLEYNYLVVRKLDSSGYSDIHGDGSLLCQLKRHSVIVPMLQAKFVVRYHVLHEFKLVVFQDMITREEIYGQTN